MVLSLCIGAQAGGPFGHHQQRGIPVTFVPIATPVGVPTPIPVAVQQAVPVGVPVGQAVFQPIINRVIVQPRIYEQPVIQPEIIEQNVIRPRLITNTVVQQVNVEQNIQNKPVTNPVQYLGNVQTYQPLPAQAKKSNAIPDFGGVQGLYQQSVLGRFGGQQY